jgi:hypothetical protein
MDRPHENQRELKNVRMLQERELDLVAKLERCIPPVDKHRHDLERVRTELASMRAAEG